MSLPVSGGGGVISNSSLGLYVVESEAGPS